MSHLEQDPNYESEVNEVQSTTQEDLDISKESFNLLSEEQQRYLTQLEESRLAFLKLADEYVDATISDEEREEKASKMSKHALAIAGSISALGVLAAFATPTLLHPALNLMMVFLPPAAAGLYHDMFVNNLKRSGAESLAEERSIAMLGEQAEGITTSQRGEYIKALMSHGAVFYNPETKDVVTLSAESRYVGNDGTVYSDIPAGYLLNAPDDIIDKLHEAGDSRDFAAPQVSDEDVQRARQTLEEMWKGKRIMSYTKGVDAPKYLIVE